MELMIDEKTNVEYVLTVAMQALNELKIFLRNDLLQSDGVLMAHSAVKLEQVASIIVGLTLDKLINTYGLRDSAINRQTRKSKRYTDQRLILSWLPMELVEPFVNGDLTIEHIKVIMTVPTSEMRIAIVQTVIREQLSAQTTANVVNTVMERTANVTPA